LCDDAQSFNCVACSDLRHVVLWLVARSATVAVKRTFQDIPDKKLGEADRQSFLAAIGWHGGSDWDALLESKRVLVVSEAGAGKTYECRTECQRLYGAGQPAFFLELATLAKTDLRQMLSIDEEARLDAWLTSQSDVATFFLDSFDELKLSLGSFEQALKQLAKGIGGQLGRAKIVITTRPIPFDEQLVRRLLPVPSTTDDEADGDTFARVAIHGRADRNEKSRQDQPKDWRTVALMPLSDAQIAEFARDQDITDPENLLADLKRRNAEEFARRPQDLLELCADWRDFKRIRTHREQVEANVRVKLKPREDRAEAAELSVDKAKDGASRLALAMMVTRRLTIRHSAEADTAGENVALDPAVVLSDWTAEERKALLERPLFGFASYGRVRFHHRSIAEYLAAERILALRARGMSTRALKRLIFAQTRGKTIVRPSLRPVAGWLALADEMIFEMLRDNEPAVLMDEADPESLTLGQRAQALRAYVERYGRGGWRGMRAPYIQIHRFAAPELADEINQLWAKGIENEEVRHVLLSLIEVGQITGSADLAYAAAIDTQLTFIERRTAVDALLAIEDSRIEGLAEDIANDAKIWPDALARSLVPYLFPRHLTVPQLGRILERVKEEREVVGDLTWHLPKMIAAEAMDIGMLEALRDCLSKIGADGLKWQDNHPHVISDRPDLAAALAATCVQGLRVSLSTEWLQACALALRLPHRDAHDDSFPELRLLIAELPADANRRVFWAEAALIQSLHTFKDPWDRLYVLVYEGPTCLRSDRDLDWIKADLADRSCPPADRALVLDAAMRLAPEGQEWRDHVAGLRPLVEDQPDLTAVIDKRLQPTKDDKIVRRWEAEHAKRQKQQERRAAKDHASWVTFWREVADSPDSAFAPERSGNTAWNLWRAMSQAGDESRSSGWNRRFIEANFGKETADRLRFTLMDQWRKDRPTLSSERVEEEKNTYLMRWQLGLAAIYAEAEEPEWASKLSEDEAKLAARYAPIELNGLPLWMEALAIAHPASIDVTLGNELTIELSAAPGPNSYSILLQSVGSAPDAVVACFLPRLKNWLDAGGDRAGEDEDQSGAAARLQQVVEVLMKRGDDQLKCDLHKLAKDRLAEGGSAQAAYIWVSLLTRLDPVGGVEELKKRIGDVEPALRSEAVSWIGNLFGDRSGGIGLAELQRNPMVLLDLLKLTYSHVRPDDDVKHVGVYSPDERDNAQSARNSILSALLSAPGEDGWTAKLELAADPQFAHLRDRIIALAEERWAEEVDSVPFNDEQAIALDKSGAAPATTNEAMFAIMLDRLQDLDDLLLRDISPREAWSGIKDERVMRREVARELTNHTNDLYKVDQEAVTAEEKETDIRLRSTASSHEAVIELKLADNRSATDLRNTLHDQLVTKYMASESSRSGCLMITLSKDRRWDHPDSGKPIGFEGLVALLRKEAADVVERLGGTLQLHVHSLDLRPRLPTEGKRTTK
jgi:hypothetical protein